MKPHHEQQRHGQHGQQRRRQNNNNRNRNQNLGQRSLDSNGPDIKIRGTATHINKKYQSLARDSQLSGNRVRAENYLQHAEHYYRIVLASQAQQQRQQSQNRNQALPNEERSESDAGGYSEEAHSEELNKGENNYNDNTQEAVSTESFNPSGTDQSDNDDEEFN